MESPVLTTTVGHTNVTAILGAVVIGQVAVAVFTTETALQRSLPLAVRLALTEQALNGKLAGAVYDPVKLALAPGASVATEKITVFAAGRSLTTVTLVSEILPMFFTVPK